MSLRFRLFLLVAGLAVLLVAGQALLVRSLAARLDRDVALVATRVGEEILSGFAFQTEGGPEGEVKRRLVVVGPRPPEVEGDPGQASGQVPGAGDPAPGSDGEAPAARWVMRREWASSDQRAATFEHRVDVKVVEGEPAHDAAAAEARFVLEPAADHDALLLIGPAHRRAIRIPRLPVVSTLDRFRSELAAGSLALLALGLVAAAAV
ncbi:MAG: hypothetical protein F9K18_06590, partial [Thermoanaerobaculia bacterium]